MFEFGSMRLNKNKWCTCFCTSWI